MWVSMDRMLSAGHARLGQLEHVNERSLIPKAAELTCIMISSLSCTGSRHSSRHGGKECAKLDISKGKALWYVDDASLAVSSTTYAHHFNSRASLPVRTCPLCRLQPQHMAQEIC